MNTVFLGYNNWGEKVAEFLNQNVSLKLIILPPNATADHLNSIRNRFPNIHSVIFDSDESVLKLLKKSNIECLISCAYKGIISGKVFNFPIKGAFNIHGALLPEFRGANMSNWMLVLGKTTGGVTIHKLEKTLDTGDILDSEAYIIDDSDGLENLKVKMFQATNTLLERNISKIKSGEYQLIKQDHSQARYYPARTPEDSKINWKLNAIDIKNLARALPDPYPGAFFFHKKNKYEIEHCEVVITNKPYRSCGKVVRANDNEIEVLTLYNKIRITKLRNCSLKNSNIHKGDYLE